MDGKDIIDAFLFRHACKEFDPSRKVPEEQFMAILEAGRLSPSSFGFEPWKFLIVQDPSLREKIKAVSWGAQKQLPTASHFMVLLARSGADMRHDAAYLKHIMNDVQHWPAEMLAGRVERVRTWEANDFKLTDDRLLFEWAARQTYIALGNMLTTAALMGIDSCPIEGFDRDKLEAMLVEEQALDRAHFGVACMAAFGYRVAPPARPKTRRAMGEVTEWRN